jgi:hypothetical protein
MIRELDRIVTAGMRLTYRLLLDIDAASGLRVRAEEQQPRA